MLGSAGEKVSDLFFFFSTTPDEIRLETTETLKLSLAMRDRIPWAVARKILLQNQVPVSHGWDKTLEAISEQGAKNVDAEQLSQALLEHMCYGEKSVRQYSMSNAALSKLRTETAGFLNPPQIPMPKVGEELLVTDIASPQLIYVARDGTGATAIYSSVRRKDEQVRITKDGLSVTVRDELSSYDEIIGIRARRVQAYDAVYIPDHGNVVEIRVDHPIGETKESVNAAHHAIFADIHAKTGGRSVPEPVNLFPIIKPLYNNPDEGIVVELAFATSTGSVKHEKMRDRGQCLRREVYHVNGKAALKTEIEPYRIGVIWPTHSVDGVEIAPELHLEGRPTMIVANDAGLHTATIRKCRNADDFDWVRAKMGQYLNK